MKFFTHTIGLGLGLLAGSQFSLRLASHRQPYPMPHQFADALDHPLRLCYRPPQKTVDGFGLGTGMTVLDLGCGTGLMGRVRLHCSGAYELPMADESVDVAVLIATFSQIPDKLSALAELYRVLKPNARLIISEELPDPAYTPANIVHYWLADTGFHYAAQSGSLFCYSTLYVRS